MSTGNVPDDEPDEGCPEESPVNKADTLLSRTEQNNFNELRSILQLKVASPESEIVEAGGAKKFMVELPPEMQNGKRRRQGRYWKGTVTEVIMNDKYPVKVTYEDGMTEEWDIDQFRKGR